jgi:prolyl oligopeptidase PreP (S9A serine peptidase family)
MVEQQGNRLDGSDKSKEAETSVHNQPPFDGASILMEHDKKAAGQSFGGADFARQMHLDGLNYAEPRLPQHHGLFDDDSFSTRDTSQFPALPERYAPTQENFSGHKVVGISQEFLNNLQRDSSGQYYGAGLSYPDVLADPVMSDYLKQQTDITLAKIGKDAFEQEVEGEKKAAAYKLPDSWQNATPVSNAIDARLGDTNGTITVGSQTYHLTEEGAQNRKLVSGSFFGSGKTLIDEPKDFVIERVIPVNAGGQDKFAVVGAQDGAAVLYVYNSAGKQEAQVPLPGMGLIEEVRQGENSSQLQFLFDSDISPPQVVTLDLSNDKAQTSAAQKDVFNTDEFKTEKLMVPYTDIDGKEQNVPVYVSHRKDLPLDRKNPALTQIYGGFNIAPEWIGYYPSSATWLQRGGVIIDPVLPGDGGRGTGNFQAGMGAGIENTERALTAAIKKVQDMGLASPETTGIYGRSNGGMVVNTLINRNPEVLGAAVSESGVDSLFDNANINVETGKYWTDEFGDPSDAEQAAWMSKLDVLTNLSADKHYPATLIEIGARDGVVNVGNGISVASIRQKMNNGETLLYTRDTEGHDPSSLDLQTAFLWSRLNKRGQ